MSFWNRKRTFKEATLAYDTGKVQKAKTPWAWRPDQVKSKKRRGLFQQQHFATLPLPPRHN